MLTKISLISYYVDLQQTLFLSVYSFSTYG